MRPVSLASPPHWHEERQRLSWGEPTLLIGFIGGYAYDIRTTVGVGKLWDQIPVSGRHRRRGLFAPRRDVTRYLDIAERKR